MKIPAGIPNSEASPAAQKTEGLHTPKDKAAAIIKEGRQAAATPEGKEGRQAGASAKVPDLSASQTGRVFREGESSRGQTAFTREVFKETAASLGFPKDALSVALLAFSRFFSLPPALLGILRREFLNLQKNLPEGLTQGNTTPTGKEKMILEAGALATAAALDKGVTLSPDALLQYSRYFVPPEAQSGQKTEEGLSHETAGKEQKDSEDKDEDHEDAPDAEKIRAIAKNESKKDGLLGFLNSLPGKNEQHWLVFPFSIKVKGIELRVFLRLLKREVLPAGNEEGNLAIVDVSGPKRQWRCFLRENQGLVQADLRVYPHVSDRALKRLKKEAERFLTEEAGVTNFRGFAGIETGNRDESWIENLCTESLPSIDKEV